MKKYFWYLHKMQILSIQIVMGKSGGFYKYFMRNAVELQNRQYENWKYWKYYVCLQSI